jgi:5-methyltetrahydrofolate--homocysteine methyltransferase
MKDKLVTAIADMKEEEAVVLVHALLDGGEDPQAILDAGREAMRIIGERFDAGEYFLPELMIGGEVMKQIGELVKPHLRAAVTPRPRIGKVLIGTIAGDIHDIGKNVVAFMLEVNNFEVHDVGVDVPETTFVEQILAVKPDVVGLSGFLTMAFEQMKRTVQVMQEAGVRDQLKVMIGGSIMDAKAAEFVGADAYGADAMAAVKLARSWTEG